MKKRGDEIEGSKAPPLLGRRKASKVRESFPFFLSSLSSIPLFSFQFSSLSFYSTSLSASSLIRSSHAPPKRDRLTRSKQRALDFSPREHLASSGAVVIVVPRPTDARKPSAVCSTPLRPASLPSPSAFVTPSVSGALPESKKLI